MTEKHTTIQFKAVDFDPFTGPEIVRVVAAIEPQTEIWASCKIGGDDANRAYNESVSLKLTGKVDFQAFELALEALVQKHESLRAIFSADGQKMCILADIQVNLVFKNLTSITPANQKLVLEDYCQHDALLPYNLENGPLFRTAFFQLNSNEFYFVFSAHHIICDGWSLGVILQDLSSFYNAIISGDTPDTNCAVDFCSYAVAQWRFADSDEYKPIGRYWLGKFQGSLPELQLPLDLPRPPQRTYKSRREDFKLNPELTSGIKSLGKKVGCSFVTTLICTFEVFLHRLTGQNDIVIGVPAAGQSAEGLTALVGHCVNLLPIRSACDGSQRFIDRLQDRRGEILDDYEHQQFTFGTLLKKLNIARNTSLVPLVPFVLNLDMGLDNGVKFNGIKHQLTYNPRAFENFEIFLNLSGDDSDLVLEWSYNTQLFKSAGIKRMMDEFTYLLENVIQNPEVLIKDLPLKGQNELITKLQHWNSDTHAAYQREKPLQYFISATASQNPDKVAVKYLDQKYSFKQIEESSDKFTYLLAEMGIGRGAVVGIAMDRCAEIVIYMLGVLKAGAAYLPIDPEHPAGRISYMLKDSGTALVVTSNHYSNIVPGGLPVLFQEDIAERIKAISNTPPQIPVTGEDLAYILYTSGSTGMPKGVKIRHRNLVNVLLSMQKAPGISVYDSFLAITTVAFDISVLELFLPLITGAELVIASSAIVRDGRLLIDLIRKERITVMQATPSMWGILLDAGLDRTLNIKMLCGGEPLLKDLAEKLLICTRSLWNVYGPTETTIWSTIKHITSRDNIITIGNPVDNTSIYILDELMHPVNIGVVGQIYIGGDGVGAGYVNNDEQTLQRFIPDPFVNDATQKMYKTGDLGKFLENGEIVCLGRADQQIKIRGYRIEPEEIEAQLLLIDGVKDTVVVAKDNRLVAYVVATIEQPEPLTQQWKQQLALVLPRYMIPDDFIYLERIPLTPNGKKDRLALAGLQQTVQRKQVYVSPVTEIQKQIAVIWCELLNLKEMRIRDDFFESGGHSLLAIQAVARLEKVTGKQIPVETLFQAPTIEQLAVMVTLGAKPASVNALVPLKPGGTSTPLYIVHGYDMNVMSFSAVAKYMDPDQPVFGLQAKGLNNIDEPLGTMEEIAKEYIDEMLIQNPSGGFALAGYSFGGYIAFEMARQLKAMGKRVKMLAMFDAYVYNEDDYNPGAVKLGRKIFRQFPKALFILNSFIKHPKETIEYQSFIIGQRFNSLTGNNDIKDTESGDSNIDKIGERYECAYRNYKMMPYDGAIDLFRVTTRLYYLDDLKYLGWKPYSKRGIRIHEIPGDHKTFLQAPNNREFARILQKALNSA